MGARAAPLLILGHCAKKEVVVKRLLMLWTSAALIVALARPAFGDVAVQTDWSGGGGRPGPILAWSNGFTAAEGIDWASPAGSLSLLPALPAEHVIVSAFARPARIAAADFDGDLDLDIVSVAFDGGDVAWWENDGTGGGWTPHAIATGFNGGDGVEARDLDHDGDVDVAAAAELVNQVVWWANDGSGDGWEQHVVDESIGGPFSVCAADFDGDGDEDLCGNAYAAGWIVWWENVDGAGASWTRHILDDAFTEAFWTVTADMNADGWPDVIGCSYALNDVCWWENDGSGAAWTKHFVDDSFAHPLTVRVADLDGDGDLDVLSTNDRGRIAWWQNDGAAGGWTKYSLDEQLNLPFALRAADLDEDGDLDVVANERFGNRVMWYENANGGAMIWLKHMVDVICNMPNDVLAADLNGDGDLDIAASMTYDYSVNWYESTDGFCAAGTLESSILDTGGGTTDWGNLTCACAAPAGTSVGLEVRASNDATNLGAWIPVASPGDDLSAYLPDETRYFQYRVVLATTDAQVAPVVDEIQISWAPASAVEGDGLSGEAILSCAARPNPSLADPVRIGLTLPRAERIELALYDAAGRKVGTVAAGSYSAGEHSLDCPGLASGVYLYRLTAGEVIRTGKFTVR